MNSDDFEKRLQSQPPRQIPTEWRTQILQSAKLPAPATRDIRSSLLSTLIHQLSTALWLKPGAWAGIAAVWGLIFALQSTSHGSSHAGAILSAQQRSLFLMTLKERKQTLAELMRNNQPSDADQPRRDGVQPRSELRSRYRIV